MEEIKSKIRPFKMNDHYKQSLKGPPLYYRVSLNSGFKRAGTTVVDATFDVQHVFPNQRADLMNGEWHVFLESFEALMASQLERTNIKVCLPDLIKSSQDYVMTAAGVCQINDAVEHVPITQEFRSAAIATYNVPAIAADSTRPQYAVPAVPVDALTFKPIAVSNVIGADDIGVKVDPVALFSGQIHVLLRNEHHAPIGVVAGAAGVPPQMADDDSEGWRATFLFVHKP